MKIVKYKYTCSLCGTEVERTQPGLKRATCYECKRKRLNNSYIKKDTGLTVKMNPE